MSKEVYTQKLWVEDKIFISRLVSNKEYQKALKHAKIMEKVITTGMRQYLNGMLLILEASSESEKT